MVLFQTITPLKPMKIVELCHMQMKIFNEQNINYLNNIN